MVRKISDKNKNGTESLMDLWLISDTHFFNERIIYLQNRPFEDVKEMNASLINRWNNKVKKNDIVFHLGNFGYSSNKNLFSLLAQLNGKITLIIGEEDIAWEKLIQLPFASLCHNLTIQYKGYHFLLTSQPSTDLLYEERATSFINVFGNAFGLMKTLGNRFNLTCPIWDYTPIQFEDILLEIRKKTHSINYYED